MRSIKVMTHAISFAGYCPICEKEVLFAANTAWYRESLKCQSCQFGSVPRERALALVMNEIAPNWRHLKIHECSPVWRGISLKVAKEASKYICTQWFPTERRGAVVNGFRNEDLQAQTFGDQQFDLFLSLDVMEHIIDPERAFKEIWRTLVPGGMMISTWPVAKNLTSAIQFRVSKGENNELIHVKPAIYHENDVSDEGSLVTADYGYDIHQRIAEWAPFDVRVYRFNDRNHGILGEFTEVFVCRKRTDTPPPIRIGVRHKRDTTEA